MGNLFKNILILLSYVFPLVIAISVFFILQKPKDITNSNEFFEEANNSNKLLIESWIENKTKILENHFFTNLKIKKENKVLKFQDLDKRKQEALKLLLYSKAKKDCDAVLINKENLQDEQYRSITKFRQSINEKAEHQKKIIYNYYGADLHPLDKMFLDEYDVYLLN
jgi:hypothetical protein